MLDISTPLNFYFTTFGIDLSSDLKDIKNNKRLFTCNSIFGSGFGYLILKWLIVKYYQ